MAVIKSSNAPATLSPFSMKDIEEQARVMLLRARGRAEQLIAEAQREGEEIRKRARDDGLAAGRAEGVEQGQAEGRKAGEMAAMEEHRAKLADLITAISAAAAELDASRSRLQTQASGEVLKLAIAIARRVTHRHAGIDPTVTSENVTRAMKLVVSASDVRIAIHPETRATLQSALPKLQAQWPQLEHVELIDDPDLSKGGCRVFTKSGEVSADLDEQIDRIARELTPSPLQGEGGGQGRASQTSSPVDLPRLGSPKSEGFDPHPNPLPASEREHE